MGDQIKKCPNVYEAPDGGWGYFICIATILIFSLTSGFIGCFGMLYAEFIEKQEIGSAAVVLIMSTNAMSLAVAGFLTSPLLKVLKFRQLAFVASFVYNAGCVGLVFVNSIIPFFICMALLQGLGFGILFNLACTIINEYFVKRRFLAMGVVQASTAIITMIIPILLNFTLNFYGYSGTLMIVAALSMNIFVAVSLMQPVKWHMKMVKVPQEDEEGKILLLKDQKNESDGIPTIKIVDSEPLSSIVRENIMNEENIERAIKDKDSVLKKILKEMFDAYLLKSYLPSYACLGMIMAMFADFVTSVTLPQSLFASNWSKEDAAFGISMMTFGDLAARLSFIVFSKYIKIENKELHMIGIVIAIIPRIGLLLTKNVYAVLVLLCIMGTSRCFILTLVPLIVADAVPKEKFTAAMGMFMMTFGIASLTLGTAVGALRDVTGSYDTIFWISIIFLVFTFTHGLLETYCLKRHKKECQKK
ncbi:monocarboxylate transporter 9 isoform X2 [Amyelois transitella]|uniref:monocarboxylate transporter 9 isoform X2 n=1 Tax=Amyelois transitella TaxID=680683 RepID=UPI00298F52A8|nr:monocarboxylate transporter 9 isoform X2 [Amyelois transitella]